MYYYYSHQTDFRSVYKEKCKIKKKYILKRHQVWHKKRKWKDQCNLKTKNSFSLNLFYKFPNEMSVLCNLYLLLIYYQLWILPLCSQLYCTYITYDFKNPCGKDTHKHAAHIRIVTVLYFHRYCLQLHILYNHMRCSVKSRRKQRSTSANTQNTK